MKRLFLAIKLSEAIHQSVLSALEQIKDQAHQRKLRIRWVPAENLHVTLKFLGELEEALLPTVCSSIEAQVRDFHPLELVVRGVGVFPNETHPRVLWVGLKDATGRFESLAHSLDAASEPFGVKRDPYPYTPHLTIGRIQERCRLGDLLFPFKFADFGSSIVNELTLFESKRRPDGSGMVYQPIKHFLFKSG